MKSLLAVPVLFFSFAAHADIIKCTFTEPFINSTYSMTQSRLTYQDFEGRTRVYNNVSFQIKGTGRFELLTRSGRVIQSLRLNYQGSDGMSDRVYPYDVQDNSGLMGANNGRGGCQSNYLRATNPAP